MEIRESDAWDRTWDMLTELGRQADPMTEKVLHQYRIVGKRARYLAELAGENPETKRVVEQLKGMQDALGEWHDWLKLTQRADQIFSRAPGSPLTAALQNLSRVKFRQCRHGACRRLARHFRKTTDGGRRCQRPQAGCGGSSDQNGRVVSSLLLRD